MQYCTNSDAALRGLIRACPTPVGQFRQAMLQIRDRKSALEHYGLSRRRNDAQTLLKETEIVELERLHRKTPDAVERTKLEAQIEILRLDIAEIRLGQSETAALVEDAIREIEVCHAEIERIRQETGIDFESLGTSEFQKFMSEDYLQKRIRYLAARTIASQMGLSSEVVEAFLELPPDDLAVYAETHRALVGAFYNTMPGQLEGQ